MASMAYKLLFYGLLYCTVSMEFVRTLSSVQSICLTQDSSVQQQCYSVRTLQSGITKAQAVQVCQDNNETLAVLATIYYGRKIAENIGRTRQAWIALSILPTRARVWKWLQAEGWFESILPDSEINDRRNGSCLLVNRMGLWSAACRLRFNTICEFYGRPPTYSDCQTKNLGHKWICISIGKYTWFEAAQYCYKKEGSLLVVDNIDTINQTRSILEPYSFHFWTAATRTQVLWDRSDTQQVNPYRLKWSNSIGSNPNLRGDISCVVITQQGLIYKRCGDRVTSVVCMSSDTSEADNLITSQFTVESSSIAPTEPSLLGSSTAATNHSAALQKDSANSYLTYTDYPQQVVITPDRQYASPEVNSYTSPSNQVNITRIIAVANVNNSYTSDSEVKLTKKYEAVIICAYILAGLLFTVGVILLIVILVKRRRKRKMKYSKRSIKTTKSVSNGDRSITLQRSADPAAAWHQVLHDNDETLPILSSRPADDIDIVHNVPLDPRATADKPLTIPMESEYVRVQRETPLRHSASSSSGKGTFTDRQSTRTNSPVPSPPPPPIPPKAKHCTAIESPGDSPENTDRLDPPDLNDFPLPPPPEDLLIMKPASPPVPPKPKMTPPPRPHRKKRIPDPIYAKAENSMRNETIPLQKPVLPKRGQSRKTRGSSDSGTESSSSLASPPQTNSTTYLNNGTSGTNAEHRSAKDELALLDEVLAQLT